ncbi:G-type lectin S-receptor-like serine/threonine-protein kinase-like protein [Drosera capensis]
MMGAMDPYCIFLVLFGLIISYMALVGCVVVDSINGTHFIKDGDTLVSAGGKFELGFFSPGSTSWRYVGIWYNKIPLRTVIWVANREAPLFDSLGVLKLIKGSSVLAIVNRTGHVVWSTSSSRYSSNPSVKLLDSGNLVVIDEDNEAAEDHDFLWQSFDYPCDIHMPGMKIGRDLATGLNRSLSSWKSSDDPSPGAFTYEINPRGYPEAFVKRGAIEQYRSGPWNGITFSGSPNLKKNSVFSFNFVLNSVEMYYVYELLDKSILMYRILNQYGSMERRIWSDRSQGWILYYSPQKDYCDTYAVCGMFGYCNSGGTPECGCVDGFDPKSLKSWEAGHWSDGCVRRTALNCDDRDGFLKYSNVKLPDTQYAWYNTSMSLKECRKKCLANCSCVAYANLYLTNGGSGCLLWIDVLIDLQEYRKNGQDLYIRVAASELERKKQPWVILCSVLVSAFLLSISPVCFIWRKKRLEKKAKAEKKDPELPLFDFKVIASATNNFSEHNKVGEGGFGSVYKGVMEDGQEIAVKRLSKDSVQGLDEFMNEVLCIAKLQHRNLVRLLGCCIHAKEQILIYEYMPNTSLDDFIFDEERSALIDWPTRLHIVHGIARGLLYLHQDSRLRIVHRDLKASNVLLDYLMNPKISDFGMAKSFYGNQCSGTTKRVVGTYGYMSPEYAIEGHFSVKSDVFSFGVLVLEIISGKRNRGFIHPSHPHNLLGHAWLLFSEGRSLELVDPVVVNKCDASEVLKLVHVALLCVQQHPDDRPSMSSVIVMLDTDCELPQPKTPGFFVARNIAEVNSLYEALFSEQSTVTWVSSS